MSNAVSKEHQLAGQGAVLVTAFLWSTSGLFIKLINWHPLAISGTRSFVAVLFLFAVRCIFPPVKGVKNPPFAFWACAVGHAFTMIIFVTANKLTASANVIILQYGAPVWAALLGWLLVKEKPRWEHWGALVLVIVGLIIFLQDGFASGALLGNVLAVLSGVLFGGYSVFLRMMKNGNPRDAMLMSHVLSAAISIPFIFLNPPALSPVPVLSILYMGTFQIGLASLLFAYGVKRISAVQAMLTATLEPILNPLWVFFITGEKPSVRALIGGGIIISAVAASSVIGKRRDAGAKPETAAAP